MVLSMKKWEGKVAIVTGASSGIGAAIVEQLVEHGLIVAGLSRRVEKVEELSKNLSGKKGKLHAVKADVSKEEDILKAFLWVTENLGPIHILINNAGVSKEGGLTNSPTSLFEDVLRVNVLGLSIATREAVKDMQTNNVNGHIIHINSVFGHSVANFPGMNVYPASKFAITALTETLRQEFNNLKLKIKITSVSPGLVATEMSTLNPNLTEDRKAMISQLPILNAEDIADGVTYALSTPEHVQIHELIIKPVGEPF